jgi:hypothetical protein
VTLKQSECRSGILDVDNPEKAFPEDDAAYRIAPYPGFGDLVSNNDQGYRNEEYEPSKPSGV